MRDDNGAEHGDALDAAGDLCRVPSFDVSADCRRGEDVASLVRGRPPVRRQQKECAVEHPSKNQGWLAQVTEAAIEPELPICDPQHHFWDGRKGAVQPRYLLDEILADIGGGHNIVSTVFIECGAILLP